MVTAGVNYWAVLVASVAYIVFGAIWYSPVLFSRLWLKGIGGPNNPSAGEFRPLNYLWAFVAAFVAAYGIARVMSWTGGDSIGDGVIVSLLIGICFVLTTLGVNDAYERRPPSLTAINAVYHMIGLVIVGIIIGAWQ